MKYIIASDFHLHPWSYGSSIINGRNSRMLFQQTAWKEMTYYAYSNNIEYIFFTGDFFHTPNSLSAETIQAAHEIFHPNDRFPPLYPVFLMGNHDVSTKSRSINLMRILATYGHTITDFVQGRVTCMPFTESKEELQSWLDQIVEPETILLMHQGIRNVPVNSAGFVINEIMEPGMLPESVSLAFSGHYHSYKKVNDRLYIPGSLTQLNWSDSGEDRGWLVIDPETKEVTRVYSNAPKFIKKNYGDPINYDEVRRNFIRVEVDNMKQANEMRDAYRQYNPLSLEVKVTNKPDETSIDRIKDFSSLMELFEEYIAVNRYSEEFVNLGKQIIG